MRPPAMAILGKPTTLVYIDVAYRVGLTVRLVLDGVTHTCTAHPTLPGVYQHIVTVSEAATYLMTWQVLQGAVLLLTEYQTLYVYNSDEFLHPTIFLVVDALENPIADVTVIVSRWASGARELVTYEHTDSEGLASVTLESGRYRASLQKDSYVFDQNNFELELDSSQEEYRFQLLGSYIEVPDITYVPPVELVEMEVKLIDHNGDPVIGRGIVVTCLEPAVHIENSTNFIATEGRTILTTSATGECSISLVPGIVVEVCIEGTSIIRRFTVPDEDFNLSDYLANSDYFSVSNNVYSPARRVT